MEVRDFDDLSVLEVGLGHAMDKLLLYHAIKDDGRGDRGLAADADKESGQLGDAGLELGYLLLVGGGFEFIADVFNFLLSLIVAQVLFKVCCATGLGDVDLQDLR